MDNSVSPGQLSPDNTFAGFVCRVAEQMNGGARLFDKSLESCWGSKPTDENKLQAARLAKQQGIPLCRVPGGYLRLVPGFGQMTLYNQVKYLLTTCAGTAFSVDDLVIALGFFEGKIPRASIQSAGNEFLNRNGNHGASQTPDLKYIFTT